MGRYTYLTLAKNASQAEREEHWKEAHALWKDAQKQVNDTHINYAWAESRAQYCHHRIPRQKTNDLLFR